MSDTEQRDRQTREHAVRYAGTLFDPSSRRTEREDDTHVIPLNGDTERMNGVQNENRNNNRIYNINEYKTTSVRHETHHKQGKTRIKQTVLQYDYEDDEKRNRHGADGRNGVRNRYGVQHKQIFQAERRSAGNRLTQGTDFSTGFRVAVCISVRTGVRLFP